MVHFGWLVAALVGFDLFYASSHVPNFVFVTPFSLSFHLTSWLRLGMWYGSLFTLYLAARPSVLPKNWAYFWSYPRHFLFFLAIALAYSWVNYLLVFILYGCNPVHMYDLGMSFILVFFALFFLDSKGYFIDGVYAFMRAIKMIVYNFPLCFIVGLFFIFLFRVLVGTEFLITKFVFYMAAFEGDSQCLVELAERVIYLLLLPIPVSLVANIYVKKVHEQFNVYF
jgi:hypothetical protein